MNKLLLSSALAAVIGLASQAALAVDGNINITGQVTASTCKINGATNPVAVNVTLPTVSTTALLASGNVAGRTPFSIALTNCGSQTQATTFFEPGPTVMADGNLKNTSTTSAATGVEVQLLNSDFSQIKLNLGSGAQNSATVALAANAGTLNYYAQYYATAAATAGAVTSTVAFSMIYQ